MSSSIDFVTMPRTRPVDVISIDHDDDDFIIAPHRHDYYEIVWSTSDRGFHSIDFVEFSMKSSRLFMIHPGQVHESANLIESVRLITFKKGFIESSYKNRLLLEKIFYSHHREPFLDIDAAGDQDLEKIFTIMESENNKPKPDWDLLSALLSSFLRYMIRYTSSDKSKSIVQDERVIRLFDLIEHNFLQQRKTSFYAGELALTGKRLNELTKQQAGKTVTSLIHERIILEAQRELAFTTKTVKTIAIELGYVDPAYFCRFFRKMVQESPQAFRARVQITP